MFKSCLGFGDHSGSLLDINCQMNQIIYYVDSISWIAGEMTIMHYRVCIVEGTSIFSEKSFYFIWGSALHCQWKNLCSQRLLRSAWASSRLCCQHVHKMSLGSQLVHSGDPDLTGLIPRLIWVFARPKCHFVGLVMHLFILTGSTVFSENMS